MSGPSFMPIKRSRAAAYELSGDLDPNFKVTDFSQTSGHFLTKLHHLDRQLLMNFFGDLDFNFHGHYLKFGWFLHPLYPLQNT